ncbi:MAG: methyltransferase domain-containing protein [Planctomycetes bacterium]|nr:methyltransferase domain-containing protein [Planctomycetota bacterium]
MSVDVNPDKLNEFLGKFVNDMGATAHAATVLLGDRLGLFKELAKGPLTPGELATRTRTAERYVREWAAAQAASGYAQYDAASGKYSLTPEQAFALADENSPAYVPGAYYFAIAMFKGLYRMEEAFRSGDGVGWHEQEPELFTATEKFFRPGYVANLVSSWLPSLEGVIPKLHEGGKVADVGCGHGVTTILMAQSFPNSKIVGFDYHEASIKRARELAKQAGLDAKRVTFEVASSTDFPGKGYDLVTFFDCLHDMGDPQAAAAHVHKSLDPEGTWMIVEPMAHDRVEMNFNPVGRLFYSASTCICCPASLSQSGKAALGAQAGEGKLTEVIKAGGFGRVRRATETPFNMVLEARH